MVLDVSAAYGELHDPDSSGNPVKLQQRRPASMFKCQLGPQGFPCHRMVQGLQPLGMNKDLFLL